MQKGKNVIVIMKLAPVPSRPQHYNIPETKTKTMLKKSSFNLLLWRLIEINSGEARPWLENRIPADPASHSVQ